MKKIVAIILSISFVCCLYGCTKALGKDRDAQNSIGTQDSSNTDMNNNGKESTDNKDEKVRYKEKYDLHGRTEQYILIHKDTNFGSYQNAHKIGDSVRLRHSNIITDGNSDPDKHDIYDYNLTFEQVLTGTQAEQKLKETCSNFDDEKFLFEDNDAYLIKVNVKYNAGSKIRDSLPIDIYVSAVNSQGKNIAVEHRFSNSEYSSKTENGEVSNWYPVFIPKGEEFKAVFVIGDPMVYPGPVAKVYYDISNP